MSDPPSSLRAPRVRGHRHRRLLDRLDRVGAAGSAAPSRRSRRRPAPMRRRHAAGRPSSPAVVTITAPAAKAVVTGSSVHVVHDARRRPTIVSGDDDRHPARPGPRPPLRRQRPRLDELRARAGPARPPGHLRPQGGVRGRRPRAVQSSGLVARGHLHGPMSGMPAIAAPGRLGRWPRSCRGPHPRRRLRDGPGLASTASGRLQPARPASASSAAVRAGDSVADPHRRRLPAPGQRRRRSPAQELAGCPDRGRPRRTRTVASAGGRSRSTSATSRRAEDAPAVMARARAPRASASSSGRIRPTCRSRPAPGRRRRRARVLGGGGGRGSAHRSRPAARVPRRRERHRPRVRTRRRSRRPSWRRARHGPRETLRVAIVVADDDYATLRRRRGRPDRGRRAGCRSSRAPPICRRRPTSRRVMTELAGRRPDVVILASHIPDGDRIPAGDAGRRTFTSGRSSARRWPSATRTSPASSGRTRSASSPPTARPAGSSPTR